MLVDTHCHLNDDRLKESAKDIIAAFFEDGIECAVCVGFDLVSSEEAVKQALVYRPLYAAVGVHPHDSKTVDERTLNRLIELAALPKTVAIGEIGLDYYYDHSPREIQQREFVQQLELAAAVRLPVILHVRDAYEDTRRILSENRRLLTNGLVLHCYSGSAEMVKVFDRFDAFYSFGGAITFKNARHNLEALAAVGRDRLLLETDCPYMTPVPFRGKTNIPAYINFVADRAAEILNTERAELEQITTNNAKTLFTRLH